MHQPPISEILIAEIKNNFQKSTEYKQCFKFSLQSNCYTEVKDSNLINKLPLNNCFIFFKDIETVQYYKIGEIFDKLIEHKEFRWD